MHQSPGLFLKLQICESLTVQDSEKYHESMSMNIQDLAVTSLNLNLRWVRSSAWELFILSQRLENRGNIYMS